MVNRIFRWFFPHAGSADPNAPLDTIDSVTRAQYGMVAGAVGLIGNLFLCGLKLLLGLLTHSISIAADAFNNLSDGLSCLVSIIGFRVSAKEPDAKHPFGYGRTEYIAGLIVSFLILLVGVEFLKTSVDRILHPEPVLFSWTLFGILAVSLLVKLWMGAFYQTIGKRIASPVLIAAGQDSRNDVITTGVVLLGMVAGLFFTLPIDGYVGVFVALFILWAGGEIARDTVAPLLGEPADPAVVEQIQSIVLQFEPIVGVHDLIIHNYGAGRSLASLHAEVLADSNFVAVHETIDEAEKAVLRQTGVFLVIHMDPIDRNNERVNALREKVDAVLHGIDTQLSMHDFRVIDGERRINLIFDVIVPFGYNTAGKQTLLQTLQEKLREIDPRLNPIVTFDHPM